MPPLYEYWCPRCDGTKTEYRSVAERDDKPDCCGWPTRRKISAPRINPDIAPYTTVAWDKEEKRPWHITSRKQHREFLKRNGYEEVGSESTIPKAKQEEIRANEEAAKDPSRKYDNTVSALT
jgi:hypothetical protein